jgi:predicted nucleic acid-binding Zn ribbon protein
MFGLNIPSEIPRTDLKTCVFIIGDHALIQTLGKLHGCQTCGEYFDIESLLSFHALTGCDTCQLSVAMMNRNAGESFKACGDPHSDVNKAKLQLFGNGK